MAQNLFISMRVSDHAHLWLMPALLLLNSILGTVSTVDVRLEIVARGNLLVGQCSNPAELL